MICFAGATAAAAPEFVAGIAGGFDKRLAPFSQQLIDADAFPQVTKVRSHGPAMADHRACQRITRAIKRTLDDDPRERHQPRGNRRASYTKS